MQSLLCTYKAPSKGSNARSIIIRKFQRRDKTQCKILPNADYVYSPVQKGDLKSIFGSILRWDSSLKFDHFR